MILLLRGIYKNKTNEQTNKNKDIDTEKRLVVIRRGGDRRLGKRVKRVDCWGEGWQLDLCW